MIRLSRLCLPSCWHSLFSSWLTGFDEANYYVGEAYVTRNRRWLPANKHRKLRLSGQQHKRKLIWQKINTVHEFFLSHTPLSLPWTQDR